MFKHLVLFYKSEGKLSGNRYNIQSHRYSVLLTPYIRSAQCNFLSSSYFNITIHKRFAGSGKKASEELIKTGLKEALPAITPKGTGVVSPSETKPKILTDSLPKLNANETSELFNKEILTNDRYQPNHNNQSGFPKNNNYSLQHIGKNHHVDQMCTSSKESNFTVNTPQDNAHFGDHIKKAYNNNLIIKDAIFGRSKQVNQNSSSRRSQTQEINTSVTHTIKEPELKNASVSEVQHFHIQDSSMDLDLVPEIISKVPTTATTMTTVSNIVSEVGTAPPLNNVISLNLKQEIKEAAEKRERHSERIQKTFDDLEIVIKKNSEYAEHNARLYEKLPTETKKKIDSIQEQLSEFPKKSWSPEQKHLLEDLNKIIVDNKLEDILNLTVVTRNMQEAYNLLEIYKSTMTKDVALAVKDFFLKVEYDTCYTSEQYECEIERQKEGYQLIHFYANILPEAIFLEVIRRAKIIQNLDAIAHEDKVGDWSNTWKNGGYPIVKKEGEGFTIKQTAYINLEDDLSNNITALLKSQKQEIITNIVKKHFELKIIVHLRDDKLLENSQERHINILTRYTTNENDLIHVFIGNPTSSTGRNTVFVADKQYVNENPLEQSKPQRLRISGNPTLVDIKELEKRFDSKSEDIVAELMRTEQRFEDFFKSNDYHGIDVHKILVDEVRKCYDTDNLCILKKPLHFDREKLTQMAECSFLKRAQELQQMHDQKQAKSQQFFQRKDEKIYNNIQKEQNSIFNRNSLDPKHKKLLNLRDQLKQDAKTKK